MLFRGTLVLSETSPLPYIYLNFSLEIGVYAVFSSLVLR